MITKKKTSLSLSCILLEELAIFNHKKNVSEFVEEALVFYLAEKKRAARRERDSEILKTMSKHLNKGAEENLEFQIPL
jgi:metal-responsive CopG/Arc/MetJ family transcriptional regulator